MISEQEILNASILIVDDQPSNVFLLEQVLRDVGYRCIASTTDPYAVCALHRDNRYDLILLDLQMPGMDGFQVMAGLKDIETGGYLPVLVITAQPDHKLRALAAGAKDFVAKPFDLLEVKMRIHNMLEVRLLYKQLESTNKVLEHYNQMLGQTVLDRATELRESEACSRRLSNLSFDWYWEQDENGHFTKIFGPALEMLGVLINDPSDNSRIDQGTLWNEAIHTQQGADIPARQPFLDFVYSRANPDGSKQYLMVSGEPILDPSGLLTGYRAVGKDVSESMQKTWP